MEKTMQTFRYLLVGFSRMFVIALFAILSNVLITYLVFYLTGGREVLFLGVVPLTAPVEVTAAIFALVTGLVLFLINFKVTAANGVSRKTFLLANLPAAALFAAVLAILNVLLVLVSRLFWPVIMSIQLFYPGISWAGLLLFQFALYLMWLVAGWLISLAYYRGSLPIRWAISLAPFLLFYIYLVTNHRTGGAVYGALREFWLTTMGSNWAASASLLAYAAILVSLVYLLIRRAPVKA